MGKYIEKLGKIMIMNGFLVLIITVFKKLELIDNFDASFALIFLTIGSFLYAFSNNKEED